MAYYITKGTPDLKWRTYTTEIPSGLRVVEILGGSYQGSFFLDEFPEELFPSGSIIRHDAEHYGVVLNRDQVLIRRKQY